MDGTISSGGVLRSFTNQWPEDFFVAEKSVETRSPVAKVSRPTEPCHRLRRDNRLIFSVFL